MEQIRPTLVFAMVLGLLNFAPFAADAARADGQEQVAVTRNASSGLSVAAQLLKREFRYVERQESYVEQVPYDVQVPYEEDETYFESENRCENVDRTRQSCHDEQSCENLTRQRRVCANEQSCENVTHYRQSCHNEQSCENVTHYRQSCHNEESCSNVPRQSCHSENVCTRERGREVCHAENRCSTEYQRECSSRNVCENEPYTERECSSRNVCENEPYNERECSNKPVCHDEDFSERVCNNKPVCHDEHFTENVCQVVNVPHTRRVTKVKTVTQYRPENRVRTVTDAIFDHSWGPAVTVVFPPEAALMADETESVVIALAGTEAAPDATVAIDSPVFSYQVASKQVSGNTITVTLALVAKYAATDLGTSTVTGLALVNTGGGRFEVRFTDAGQAARVKTNYRVSVVDRSTGASVFEAEQAGALGVRDVAVAVTGALNVDDDHTVKLDVAREGIVLAAPVAFEQSADQLAQLDPAVFTDVNGVREFSVQGAGSSAALVFTDTGSNLVVHSVYDVTIEKKVWGFLWQKAVAHGSFEIANLSVTGTRVRIPMSGFAGLSARALDRLFGGGTKLLVKIAVRRESTRLAGHSPILIRKQADLKIVASGRSGD